MPFGERLLDRLRWLAWVCLLLSLPITSFPFFPSFAALGETLVRPLALYPLVVLLLIDWIPYLLRGGRLPRNLLPLLGFTVVALVSTLLNLLQPSLPLRGQVPNVRAIRAFVTLGLGLGFLLVSIRSMDSRAKIVASLRWLILGMAVAVSWGLLQGSRLVLRWPHYAPLNAIQRLVAIQDMQLDRVTGLSYEPSWFADQLVVLVLPILLAAILTGYRLILPRLRFPVLEVALLLASIVVLVLTYSRGGVLAFGLSAGLGLVVIIGPRWREIARWLAGGDPKDIPRRVRVQKGVLRSGLALALTASTVSVVAWLALRNWYFTLLWRLLGRIGNPTSYLLQLGAGTRYALAVAAWGTFIDHPWLGVGLGQSGFYLFDHLPGWAFDRIVEMTLMLTPGSWTFPNPKNLWIRLLAETGIPGTLLFVVFMLIVLAGALALMARKDRFARFLGTAGLMSWLAIVVEGFSLDSFALPTLWIALALTICGCWILVDGHSEGPEGNAADPAVPGGHPLLQ
jgi:O-antigen ligase